MKPSIYRRIRRRSAHEGASNKKENKQEQSFFSDPVSEHFFKPATSVAPTATLNRKCAECEKEEKQVQKKQDKKEEENKLMKKEDKKEVEKLQKKENKKEEEKLMKKEEDKEDEKVQKKEAGGATTSASTGSYISSLNGKGSAMPADANSFFSSRMGYNFSNVRVHTDKEAAQSAKNINAKAYTIGNHIVFNEGQFNIQSPEGQKLMAHELVHVLQQAGEQNESNLNRKPVDAPEQAPVELLPPLEIEVEGSKTQNTTHNGDCNGVSVSGSTDANYSSSGSLSGRPTKATDCSGCAGSDCITVNGTVVSVFTTAPTVSLPAVPGGLNACEQRAVRNFINTTLSQHEQQHVSAFNTYRGRVRTPISFTGCSADLQTEVQNIHDSVEVPRRAASDAASAALDANGANIFTITCECPDSQSNGGTP